jgi:hypothetical protein
MSAVGPLEKAIQADIVRNLAAMGYYAVAVPNGAVLAGNNQQRYRQVNALKKTGMSKGFPDLIVFGPPSRVGFVEVKRKGAPLDNEQQIGWRNWLTMNGYQWGLVRSVEDILETLDAWGWNEARPIGQIITPIIADILRKAEKQ